MGQVHDVINATTAWRKISLIMFWESILYFWSKVIINHERMIEKADHGIAEQTFVVSM